MADVSVELNFGGVNELGREYLVPFEEKRALDWERVYEVCVAAGGGGKVVRGGEKGGRVDLVLTDFGCELC